MSELTREYLDKKLDKLVTKENLKDGLDALESNLKLHTEQEVADLAGMMSRRFDELA